MTPYDLAFQQLPPLVRLMIVALFSLPSLLVYEGQSEYVHILKWAKGKYPFTSAGSIWRLLTTGVTVPTVPSPSAKPASAGAEITNHRGIRMCIPRFQHSSPA